MKQYLRFCYSNFTVTFLIVYLSSLFSLSKSRKTTNLSFCPSFSFYTPLLLLFHPYLLFYLPCFLLQHELQLFTTCCHNLVGQPSIPLGSPFFKVRMNKDFWGFLSYPNQISIALVQVCQVGCCRSIRKIQKASSNIHIHLRTIPWQLKTQVDMGSMAEVIHL